MKWYKAWALELTAYSPLCHLPAAWPWACDLWLALVEPQLGPRTARAQSPCANWLSLQQDIHVVYSGVSSSHNETQCYYPHLTDGVTEVWRICVILPKS